MGGGKNRLNYIPTICGSKHKSISVKAVVKRRTASTHGYSSLIPHKIHSGPPQEEQAEGLVLPSQLPDLTESHRTERVWS